MPIVRDLEADYPQRISNRPRRINGDRYYYHGSERYRLMDNIIYGIVEQYVGKSVDKAYSAVCKRFASGWDGFDYRKQFWDMFDTSRNRYVWSRYNTYQLKGKIIKRIPPKVRDRSIQVGGHYETVYMLDRYSHSWNGNYTAIKPIVEIYFKMRGWDLSRAFTREERNELISTLTEWYRQHPEKMVTIFGDWYDENSKEQNRHDAVYAEQFKEYLEYALKETKILVDTKKAKRHSKELYDAINERAREAKAQWKEREEEYERRQESYNYTLWSKKKTRMKKEDSDADTINRDRLGFDDKSFKGEFYHGQKRKKKINK